MHAISRYRGTVTDPHTHRQDRLQYTAPQLVRSVNIIFMRLNFLCPAPMGSGHNALMAVV